MLKNRSTLQADEYSLISIETRKCASYSNADVHAYGQGFVIFVAIVGIIFTVILLVAAVANLVEKFNGLPWIFGVRQTI